MIMMAARNAAAKAHGVDDLFKPGMDTQKFGSQLEVKVLVTEKKMNERCRKRPMMVVN